jgi:hypothetical protein
LNVGGLFPFNSTQETFEFLNVLQVHGFPRIMGVLTHMDEFKSAKTLKNTKKQMKHRFWTEIYQGAKLFYLTGLHANGRYKKRYSPALGSRVSPDSPIALRSYKKNPPHLGGAHRVWPVRVLMYRIRLLLSLPSSPPGKC